MVVLGVMLVPLLMLILMFLMMTAMLVFPFVGFSGLTTVPVTEERVAHKSRHKTSIRTPSNAQGRRCRCRTQAFMGPAQHVTGP